MADAARNEVPPYSEMFQDLLDALKALGGSGTPSEVRDHIAKQLGLSDAALEATLKSGETVFSNRVQWARLYLAKSGFIGSSKRGIWSLTDAGRRLVVDDDVRRKIVADVVQE